jgi:hypothetical protein
VLLRPELKLLLRTEDVEEAFSGEERGAVVFLAEGMLPGLGESSKTSNMSGVSE